MKPVNDSPLQVLDKSSPCVNQCQLDSDYVCKGCGRTLDEIDSWSTLDPTDKENVFRIANERLFKKLAKN